MLAIFFLTELKMMIASKARSCNGHLIQAEFPGQSRKNAGFLTYIFTLPPVAGILLG